MKKRHIVLPVLLVALLALMVSAAGPRPWNDDWKDNREEQKQDMDDDSSDDSSDDEETVEFDEAEIFFEFNSTDLDLGIHIFFDAVGWTEVEVEGPDGSVFEVENGGGLNRIGSTEVFTESAEPPLDEDNLAAEMAAFLAMFPEGEYEFEGETTDGLELEGSAWLTHDLPAPPMMIFPDPEAEENIADPEDMVVEWADGSVAGDPEVERFHVVVEFEDEVTEEVFVFAIDVPADSDAVSYGVTVPAEFFESLEDREGDYKAEIVAIEEGKNATIVETEFELE